MNKSELIESFEYYLEQARLITERSFADASGPEATPSAPLRIKIDAEAYPVVSVNGKIVGKKAIEQYNIELNQDMAKEYLEDGIIKTSEVVDILNNDLEQGGKFRTFISKYLLQYSPMIKIDKDYEFDCSSNAYEANISDNKIELSITSMKIDVDTQDKNINIALQFK